MGAHDGGGRAPALRGAHSGRGDGKRGRRDWVREHGGHGKALSERTGGPEGGDGQGTHRGQCPAGGGTGPPRALRHWRGHPGSQSAHPGWFSCAAAPPGATLPGLLLLLLGRVRPSSPSLGPLCCRWCKRTAALGRQCVRARAGLRAPQGLQPQLRGVGLPEAAGSPPRSPSPSSPSTPLLCTKIRSRPCKDGASGKRGR